MKDIHSCVVYLNKHHDIDINSLDKKSKIYRYIQYLKNQDYNDIHILKSLDKALNYCYWPSNIEIGTVGAFLFGCRQSSYGDINRECSPLCIGSLPNSMEVETCDNQVWILKKDGLSIVENENFSNNAVIYTNDNFDGMSSAEISTLKNNYVSNISMYTTEKSKHWLMSQNISIKDIPRKKKKPQRSFSLRSLSSEILEKKSPSKVFIIIIVVVILLIIIMLLMK